MTNRAESAKLNWPRWKQALLIVLLAVLVTARLIAYADGAASSAGLTGPIMRIDGSLGRDPSLPRYFRRVDSVIPGGELEKAGIRAGDAIRPYPYNVASIRYAETMRVPFVLDRDGVRSSGHFMIKAVVQTAAERQANFWLMLNRLAAIFTILIGCLILWRGWGNKTAMLLGACLIPLYIATAAAPPVFGNGIGLVALLLILRLSNCMIFLLPVFAMQLHAETAGGLRRGLKRAILLFVAVAMVQHSVGLVPEITGFNLPVWFLQPATYLFALAAIVLCTLIVAAAWRRSDGIAGNRNAVILFAFLAYLLGAASGFGSFVFGSNGVPYVPLAVLNLLMAGVLAPGLLAYAVLRHKLFDLGFAVNRTLVFGAVGLLLLVSFALIEWAIKQAIPKVWYGGSVYISAVIAVGLYLTFNRLHHRVEHAIERLFFYKWQLNEAALKRFVAAAAHVEKPEALAGNFTAELVRFTGGAAATLYARSPEGHYASAAGEAIDADDPALAALRAEQDAVVPAEISSPIDAALALPMMHQAALAGFVLLGPKPSGEDYRPDEIEILGWATQQVGLDLQAIRVRDLEQSVVKLEARNANLSKILAKAAAAKA